MSVLSPAQRAAVVLTQLRDDQAARILQSLTEPEVIAVMAEIARLPVMTADEVHEIVDELFLLTGALRNVRQGGTDVAERLLRDRLGAVRASEVLSQLQETVLDDPLGFINRIDAIQIVAFMTGEHPQTLALVLTHINRENAANILERLDEALRVEVTRRIAKISAIPPDVVKMVGRELELRLSAFVRAGGSVADINGISAVVEMLNHTERSTEKQILSGLERADPDVAEQVKNEMFVFDDVIRLDDASLQLVLRQVQPRNLAIALKGKPTHVMEKFMRNISENAAADLAEDMASLGPQRLSAVEASEAEIVKLVRQLAEAGDITIERGGDELVA